VGLRVVNRCYLEELESAARRAEKREQERDPSVEEMKQMFASNRSLASIQLKDGRLCHRNGSVTRVKE